MTDLYKEHFELEKLSAQLQAKLREIQQKDNEVIGKIQAEETNKPTDKPSEDDKAL